MHTYEQIITIIMIMITIITIISILITNTRTPGPAVRTGRPDRRADSAAPVVRVLRGGGVYIYIYI